MYRKIKKHYEREYSNLVKFATRRVLNYDKIIAEECVQETYTRICSFINSGGSIVGEPDGFIYKTLFNCIFDSNTNESLRGLSGSGKAQYENKDISDINVLDDVDLFESMALRVAKGDFDDTPERTREVLKQYFIDGYSYAEIGSALGMKIKTCRNIVYMHLKGVKNE